MSIFEASFAPAGLDVFKEHFEQGRCLVLQGPENKFAGLVSLQDIERRLNDGCNANSFPQVIAEGARAALVDSDTAWSPSACRKRDFANAVQKGQSFMLPNSSQITKAMATYTDELESFFTNQAMHADVHLYVSVQPGSNSYHAHRDLPQHKILLQLEGEVVWQLFEPRVEIADNVRAIEPDQQDQQLELVSEFSMTKGDLLYMPPGVFHRVIEVVKPRVSASIPFYELPHASKMDRSHIPFSQIFESNARTAEAG